jgi:predicted HTH transcriptional regulator
MQLQELVVHPREDLAIEIKGWLDLSNVADKANLAQSLMAMANHGGGFILIGFTET